MSARQPPRVRRGFVTCGQGQLHYRIAGHGPPVILLPESPRSSNSHRELLESLGRDFTAISFDLPGCGNSTALAAATPEITDYARALADALSALGLERSALYGYHGSSKIVLEFAALFPDRVGVALLEGLPLPLGPPDREFLARFTQPVELSDDGSHLAREWTRVRDLHRFFPWFARNERSRLAEDLPDERHLHDYAVDLFSAGSHAYEAFGAGMRYAAQSVIARVQAPTVVMCREDDFLYRYLDALPEQLPDNVRIERLTPDREQWRERLAGFLREASGSASGGFSPPDPLAAAPARHEVRGYVALPHGQVHVRRQGHGHKRPALLLHETPGSSAQLRPLMQELAKDRTVVAIDLPGLGDSDALPNPDAAAHRQMLLGVLDALGLTSVDVVAEFTSTAFAIDLARAASNRVHRLVLDGVLQLTAGERRALWKQYCPGVRSSWDGSHLLTLWHRLRDQELNWPWYERSRAGIRRRPPEIGAERLQAMLLDVLKRLEHYGDACLAAFDFPIKEALEEVRQPVLLPQVTEDVRYQWTRKVSRRLKDARVSARAASHAERAAQYAEFLDR